MSIIGSRFPRTAAQRCLTKGAELVEPTFLAKITSWRLSRDIPKGLHRDLENIKTQVEGSAT
ncbi:MAG: hypothetical protein L0206_00335 [Actinobacteria bacterium]|nr:hypothetical protein [Actinomycetota bacterium]